MRISDWSSDVCSSDLVAAVVNAITILRYLAGHEGQGVNAIARATNLSPSTCFGILKTLVKSEEHTSELQSLMRISYAVFCLKKKKQIQAPYKHKTHLKHYTIHTKRYISKNADAL